MAKSASIEGKLDTLTTLVEKGFAAVADDIASIKERMATKADVAELRLEFHTFPFVRKAREAFARSDVSWPTSTSASI